MRNNLEQKLFERGRYKTYKSEMVIEKEVEEEQEEEEKGKQICITSNKGKVIKLRLKVDTRERREQFIR